MPNVPNNSVPLSSGEPENRANSNLNREQECIDLQHSSLSDRVKLGEEFQLTPPHNSDSREMDGDSLDTIELSPEVLAQISHQHRVDNRTPREFFSALREMGVIDCQSVPELFCNQEFREVINKFGGKIDFVPAGGDVVSYIGIFHSTPGVLEIAYNTRVVDRLCKMSFRGELGFRHPELTILHEVVGHGHHFMNWRCPVSEGGGLSAGALDALARVMKHHEFNLFEQLLEQERHFENPGQIPAKDKVLATSFSEKIFTFLSERRAWQKEVDYFLERKASSKLSDDFIFEAPESIGSWLDGEEGFNAAFKDHLFYGSFEKGYNHYLSGFPVRWQRYQQLLAREEGKSEVDPEIRLKMEEALSLKLESFFSTLNRLPEITECPEDFLR